jgi:hypothetical protein
MRNLLLPSKPHFAVNLCLGLEVCAEAVGVEQHGAEDDLVWAQGLLVVVDVRGAVLAVELGLELVFHMSMCGEC